MNITLASLEETYAFAKDFVLKLKPSSNATVVGLYGDLGAGKTAFTKGVAKAFGVEEDITSPTFVIEKIYALSNQCFDTLIHIDAYRLEKAEELARLGWNNLLKDPKNIILIEWPEKVAEIMPKDHTKLFFTFIDENTRTISIQE